MSFKRVDSHPHLIKGNGVVHNINKSEIERAKQLKKQKLKNKNELNELKNKMERIEDLLTKLLEKK